MSAHSRRVFSAASIVFVVAACLAAGCSAYQTAPGGSASPPAATGRGNAVAIKNFAFDPSPLTVKSGSVITWTNQDSAPHTIVSDSVAPEQFSSASLSTGASYSVTFTKPGTYAYHCSIHPSMKGTVIVE